MFEIRPSGLHGRGLFATRHIAGGELVSTAAAVLVDNDTRLLLEGGTLAGMFVEWDGDGTGALPLGPLAFVNHDDMPNCELAVLDDEVLGPAVQLWSVSPVDPDEELTIDYLAGDPERTLWFG